MGFLAAIGALRVLSGDDPEARLRWTREAGRWVPVLTRTSSLDPVGVIMADLERWRAGHGAIDFAVDAGRKVQDLKHPPDDFRRLMRSLATEPETAAFVAAYATGVATDQSGQTKPTSLHFAAGQQRFMDIVLDLRSQVTREDIEEALDGPWVGRAGPKDPRWRAASDRSRALLSFDPSKEKAKTVAGAGWLAFQAMPLLPAVPHGNRVITTGFRGRGKNEQFVWPVWCVGLTEAEVRVTLGLPGLENLSESDRRIRGIATVFRSRVQRSSQGYGNFLASEPV